MSQGLSFYAPQHMDPHSSREWMIRIRFQFSQRQFDPFLFLGG